jgi:hypothetical protein
LAQLQRLLEEMDQRWRKVGLARRPHETCHQFAERLSSATSDPSYSQAAQWYRQFAVFRFSGQVDAASIQKLHEAFGAAVAVRITQRPNATNTENGSAKETLSTMTVDSE